MNFILWIIVALLFLIYASYEFYRALRKKEPAWRSLRKWIVKIIDIISGGW